MKYLPIIAMAVAISACAAQPPAGVQSVGTSQQPPKVVGQCIAKKWADKSQQQISSVNAQAEAEAYLDALRGRSKVKMYGSLDNPQSGE